MVALLSTAAAFGMRKAQHGAWHEQERPRTAPGMFRSVRNGVGVNRNIFADGHMSYNSSLSRQVTELCKKEFTAAVHRDRARQWKANAHKTPRWSRRMQDDAMVRLK